MVRVRASPATRPSIDCGATGHRVRRPVSACGACVQRLAARQFIACGAVLGGESLRGHSGNAADLGLMPVPPSALPSAPAPEGGKWDILLSRASLNALTRHLRHGGTPVVGHPQLEAMVASGRPEVGEWLDDCVDALVPAVRATLAVLDLPARAFASYDTAAGHWIVAPGAYELRLEIDGKPTGIAPAVKRETALTLPR